jgi:cellulose synthase/poly-beta-1,6-N-acetylglucosamine synthase-like glycosyltransferase
MPQKQMQNKSLLYSQEFLMKYNFFFLNRDFKSFNSIEIEDFLLTLNASLRKDLILKKDFPEKLKRNLLQNPTQTLQEFLFFLYQNYSEDKIKLYISNHFDFLYLKNQSSLKNFLKAREGVQIERIKKLDIDSKIIKLMQSTKTVPIFINKIEKELYILTDSIDLNIEKIYCGHFSTQTVIYILGKKQTILDFLCAEYEDLLISDLKQASQDTSQKPTAKNLEGLIKKNKFKIICLVVFLSYFSISNSIFLICLLFLISGIFFCANFFKIFLVLNFLFKKNDFSFEVMEFYDSKICPEGPNQVDEKDFLFKKNREIYTILLPVLNENQFILNQLIKSIKNINYPLHMLDVLILIEDDDHKSSLILESIQLDYIFEILKVPKLKPRTKAKACNFGLNFASGKFLTIFDADDIPDENQLLDVLNEFEKKGQTLSSVQCLLNPYNHQTNRLTKFYSFEYSIWFKCFLKSLNSIKMPITFGGTSNHFKTLVLRKYHWDSYNVTEDADLGVYFWLKDCKISIIDSETAEEAPISFLALIGQRSRWIKGFLQTYFVNINSKNHSHLSFFKRFKFLIWMNFFLFFPIFSQFLTIFIPIKFLILKFFFKNEMFFGILFKIYFLNFLIYYFGQIFILFINSKNLLEKPSLFDFLSFPIYLFFNILATYKAVWGFFMKQYYWEKTLHGFFKKK